ncbi:hypothetical protein AWB69_06856 [Caballeronia udeis]|uniref:Uncharacterized protein n=1 Tax=Caballeronia udeis TaxID=1232866 RepID=A0A158IZU5_9BURK|nr:hypothetical protein [Caballeronia udeis]SAL61610.1 hypothetical protein AWB69_06856 [Caballeronia udeis]
MSRLRLVPLESDEVVEESHFVSVRDQRFESSAIVRDVKWYAGQPHERISRDALKCLFDASEDSKPYNSYANVAIRLLDIYLQITDQRISLRDGRLSPKSVLLKFAGALYSESFWFARRSRRHSLVCTVRDLAAATRTISDSMFPQISTKGPTLFWAAQRAKFEVATLDTEAVVLARGWPVANKDGLRWLDLRALHLRYGSQFACEVQAATQRFYDGRDQESIHQISFLLDYLANLPPNWRREHFGQSDKSQRLFAAYALHFAKVRGRTHDYDYIKNHWAKGCNFLRKAFFSCGLFASPLWGLPEFPSAGSPNRTHERSDGAGGRYSTKLLTNVPLKLTDKEAAELLFRTIRADLARIQAWADARISEIWNRYKVFLKLSASGTVREFSKAGHTLRKGATRRTHESWQENVAATYAARGFETPNDEPRLDLLYGAPRSDVYSIIALPTAGSLLAHMAALVIEHPLLTPSFFTELTLYDKDDRVAGVSEIDSRWVLDGKKARKGPDTAQQKVPLSDRAAEILGQVIKLTQPLRNYLKGKGDPSWRRIFIETGKGFDDPGPVVASKRTSGVDNVNRLTNELVSFADMREEDARRLAKRFSLVTLRASEVVARYLKKPDLAEAAKNLGHERLSFHQIERYVPPPLIAFFQERWVRIFQNAVIAEALKDSEYRLRATDFESSDELNQFLNNHALRLRGVPAEARRQAKVDDGDSQVYFAASVETLTVLEGIRRAVRRATVPPTALAVEWADYADRLFRYIKHAQPPREELIVMLEEAECHVEEHNFDRAIYA